MKAKLAMTVGEKTQNHEKKWYRRYKKTITLLLFFTIITQFLTKWIAHTCCLIIIYRFFLTFLEWDYKGSYRDKR